MGTTATHGLPYPEPSGRARNGSVDIKALAEAVDAKVSALIAQNSPAFLTSDPSATAIQAPITSPVAATFAGFVGSSEFAHDGTTLTYSGPERWFVLDFQCEASSAGAVSSETRAKVVVNGATVVGEGRLTTLIGGGGTAAHQTQMSVSMPLRLGPGFTIAVTLEATAPGGGFANKQIAIASIGPRP